MRVYERHIKIPVGKNKEGLLAYLSNTIPKYIEPNEIPVRFVVTGSTGESLDCEIGVLAGDSHDSSRCPASLFEFRIHDRVNDEFNAVVVIPTGIGAETGGHSGDANRVIRLLASICDNLVTHPNAVNAADINEMPENCQYVEGSVLSRLLMGTIGLRRVRANRVLVVADDLRNDANAPGNKLFTEATINAVSAARATLGLDCSEIVLMKNTIGMHSKFAKSGRAIGVVEYLERLLIVLDEFSGHYDAVALSTVVAVPNDVSEAYFQGGLVNPWGGVEAMLTHAISSIYSLPTAHAPMLESVEKMNVDVGIVDPRMAAEVVSLAAFHSVLKGLHKSPKVIPLSEDIPASDLITASKISCLITPDGCLGLPHLAALEQGIPVIAVKDGQQTMKNRLDELAFQELYFAENYLEAVGIMQALKEGIKPYTINRPFVRAEDLLVER